MIKHFLISVRFDKICTLLDRSKLHVLEIFFCEKQRISLKFAQLFANLQVPADRRSGRSVAAGGSWERLRRREDSNTPFRTAVRSRPDSDALSAPGLTTQFLRPDL